MAPETRTRLLRGLRAVRRAPTRAVVTVGVFDGVHIAHQRLIQSTRSLARRLGGTSVIITFDPDPQLVLHPDQAHPALMPLEARLRHLTALGVDRVWVIPFTRRFARLTAEQFLRRILLGRLHAVAMVVGETFVFGRGRRGSMAILHRLGPPQGMRVVAVAPILRGGAPVSSSRIRHLIATGRLTEARRLLGRPPALYGCVVSGAGRGKPLGFPTANIQLTSQVLPPRGVYAVLVHSLHDGRWWRGVMNLGVRPTFGPGPLVCEVHLLGFSGTLHGWSIAVSLLARLRGERCFPSPHALRRQIRRDIRRATHLFARHA